MLVKVHLKIGTWYGNFNFVDLQKLLESNYISMSMFVIPALACKFLISKAFNARFGNLLTYRK